MVSIIEHKGEAGEAPYVELRVGASAHGTLGNWEYAERAGARAALMDWDHDTGPVDEAFRDAVRFAVEHGIPFVWVNDPQGLFPPGKRPLLP